MSASIDGTAIDKVLRDAVDSGGVPHVAAIAADRDGCHSPGLGGSPGHGGHPVQDHVDDQDACTVAARQQVEQGNLDLARPSVTVDTLFRIMSMTKMPCTVAALQQVEQGNLDLDAPVADYCPEFAEIQD